MNRLFTTIIILTCFNNLIAASKPTVTTKVAFSIDHNSATIDGTINPNGSTTSYYFEYGVTASFGSQTSTTNLGSGTNAIDVPEPLTALQPNTTYYYRLKAANSLGITTGSTKTFTTFGKPTVTTKAAFSINNNSVTFDGSVNPNGFETHYYYDYGITPSFGNETQHTNVGSGTSSIDVPEPMSGLQENTIYYFRLRAYNTYDFSTPGETFLVKTFGPPSVETKLAFSLEPNSLTFDGSVNPNGSNTSCYFEYGTTVLFGNQTPISNLGSGTNSIDVPEPVTGLDQNKTYYYRLIATNSYGESIGELKSAGTTPVEIVSFNTQIIENKSVKLSWQTASETNNYGFEIEKSTDKQTWQKVGFVKGKGTTTETQSYTFSDQITLTHGFYRLKQLDNDGKYEYSKILEFSSVPENFSLSQSYPNPFNPKTVINYQLPVTAMVELKVYDLLGGEVQTLVNEQKPAGNYSISFDGSNLSSGIYLYQIKAGNFTETKRMMLVK